MKLPIYLDYNATTPIDIEVANLMKEIISSEYGNPSSSHLYGRNARKIVEEARKQVAALINCNHSEIIFTSGGTEANNIAIRGVAEALQHKGKHIITSVIEHPSVEKVCSYLENKGFTITKVPVDEYGIVIIDEIEKAITKDTILITIMHSNNETGSLQPIKEIGEIANKKGIIVHTDAAQSAGKVPLDINEMGVSLLSLAGHKFYAPKGIGALYIRKGTPLANILFGAEQERAIRPGTEDVISIAALGKAAEISSNNLEEYKSSMLEMRDTLYQKLIDRLLTEGFEKEDIKLNGHPLLRLPNTLNISFKGVNASTLNAMLSDKVAFSCGAACHSYDDNESAVLQSMNLSPDYIKGTIRLSVGRKTNIEEINEAVNFLVEAVGKLKPPKIISELTNDKDRIMTPDEIKLTHYTAGLGCACKLEPSVLEAIVKQLPVLVDSEILVGPETSDDAAVYRIDDDKAIVLTLDFFNPIVDDAREFGIIAATNSLSDIYAMGATPLFALNIVGFPIDRLPAEILSQILAGAIEKTNEAGIPILGGHTVKDVEPKYGLVVAGLVHPDKILTNNNAKLGDVIVLTKPLGVGIISSALKSGIASDKEKDDAIKVMSELNKYAAETLKHYKANSCTDVTGFGLLGHLAEIVQGSNVEAEVYADKVPCIEGVEALIERGVTPGTIFSNTNFYEKIVDWGEEITDKDKYILFDAQTSGGLLITMPEEEADKYVQDCKAKGMESVAIIGRIIKEGNGKILVR